VAIDPSGNAIAVWAEDNGLRSNIWSNRVDGTSWGTAVLIESDDSGAADKPQVVMDASGKAIAVWSQSDGSATGVWSNRYD
jgi:hypothetical protein